MNDSIQSNCKNSEYVIKINQYVSVVYLHTFSGRNSEYWKLFFVFIHPFSLSVLGNPGRTPSPPSILSYSFMVTGYHYTLYVLLNSYNAKKENTLTEGEEMKGMSLTLSSA